MKIKDLITKLKQFDPELEVIIMEYDETIKAQTPPPIRKQPTPNDIKSL